MRLLITGSRKLSRAATLQGIAAGLQALHHAGLPAPTLLLHGGASGADLHAEDWAKANGLPTEVHAPDYQQHYPKAAPLERNRLLVAKADAVLALYAPGRERKGGTWDTVQKAVAAGLPIAEAYPDGSTTYTPPPAALW